MMNTYEYLPIIQFGTFSPTFEYRSSKIDYDELIILSAFLLLPKLFTRESAYNFIIDKNRYLSVEREQYKKLLMIYKNQLTENYNLIFKIKEEFQKRLLWKGWEQILVKDTDEQFVQLVLENFFYIHQLVWFCVIIKETMVREYRKLLKSIFFELNEKDFEEIYLDSLIMPEHSYILQSYSKKRYSSDGVSSHDEIRFKSIDELVLNRFLESNKRRKKALSQIVLQSKDEAENIIHYLEIIRILVSISEEKNLKVKDNKAIVKMFFSKQDVSLTMKLFGTSENYNSMNYPDTLFLMVNKFNEFNMIFEKVCEYH